MADIKEKLIALVDDYTEKLSVKDIHKADFAEKFADHLLAGRLIEELQNEAYDLGVDSALHNHFGLSWEDAAGLRKEVTRLQNATKWIPVTERLPDTDGKYLVHKNLFGDSYIKAIWFAKDGRKVSRYDFENRWKNVWYEYDSEYGYITIDSVTHWMPLPEPPTPEFRFEKGYQPHGAEQFAKACGVCVNQKSDLCRECKMEKKSGFEPPF